MLPWEPRFLLPRSEKVIIGRVAALRLRGLMRFVAWIAARFATTRMHALDLGHFRQRTLPGIAYNVQEQPWNGVRIKSVDVRGGFPSDLAAILQFPCRSGDVLADHLVFPILQLGFRSLECPVVFACGVALARVYLRTRGVYKQPWLTALGNRDRVGNIRSQFLVGRIFLCARDQGH